MQVKNRALVALTACLIAFVVVAVPMQAATTITVAYRAAEGQWLEWVKTESREPG